eukprot:scaffold35264_cov30-Phaeocystis_antarctica.AAC.1
MQADLAAGLVRPATTLLPRPLGEVGRRDDLTPSLTLTVALTLTLTAGRGRKTGWSNPNPDP